MLEWPYKHQLESLIFLALCRERWLHRTLSCGNTLLWNRLSKRLPDKLRSSTWDSGFLLSSWWARWTQLAGTESNECLITDLVGAEAAQTVRAEWISLERLPGMKSIKAEIKPHSSRVVEKAGHEFTLLACALSMGTARSALPYGVALLLPAGAFVLAALPVLPHQPLGL